MDKWNAKDTLCTRHTFDKSVSFAKCVFCNCLLQSVSFAKCPPSFAEYCLFYRALLQKRPIILLHWYCSTVQGLTHFGLSLSLSLSVALYRVWHTFNWEKMDKWNAKDTLCNRHTFVDGYCSTVQGLLDWFEVDFGSCVWFWLFRGVCCWGEVGRLRVHQAFV